MLQTSCVEQDLESVEGRFQDHQQDPSCQGLQNQSGSSSSRSDEYLGQVVGS